MWYSINNSLVTICGYPLSYIELAGTLTGLISVWLATRANIWTWPTGLINVACFFVIFFQVRLYADMFLQVYFFITSVYGWWVWGRRSEEGSISVLSTQGRWWLGGMIMASTLIVGYLVKNIHLLLPSVFDHPASYPFTDSLVSVLSVLATILLAKKRIENWVLWILVDLLSVALYAKKGVLVISAEYFIFLCLAAAGLVTWLKILKNEKRLSIR